MKYILMVIGTLVLLALALTVSLSYAADVRLAWDAQADPDLAGFRVCYGNAPASHPTCSELIPPADRTTTVTGLDPALPWFIVVRAVDVYGAESPDSNEVRRRFPQAPSNMRVPKAGE